MTAAKQLVSRETVAIDMPAGPSEVLVCADAQADPAFVAADLLAQAEHGIDSQVVSLVLNAELLEATLQEVERQVALLPRAGNHPQSLGKQRSRFGKHPRRSFDLDQRLRPGALDSGDGRRRSFCRASSKCRFGFLGNYTPESVGDYASGTNHTLPTNGYARARAYSGVSLDSFVKKITFQRLTAEGLKNLGPTVETMAIAEELVAHQRAVSIRLEKNSSQVLDCYKI